MKTNLAPVVLFAIACLMIGCVPVSAPTEIPTIVLVPTEKSHPILPSSTSIILPSPTVVQEAPLCTTDPLAGTCSTPKVGTLSKFCVKKLPYTLLGIPPASTFQPMDPTLICKDEGIRGEVRQVSCTGQQLYSYEIKVCDANCSGAQLETGSDRCPDGYGYSAEADCCWLTSTLEPGCVIYKVDIGSCQ
jgi:hypothetical protein